MAKSVGKFTGLGYRPLQGDISNDILNAEDQEFKHRAEDRLEEDRKAAAKAKKDAARKASLAKVKNNKLFDTKSDSLNQVIGNTVKLAQQEYDDIFKILENQDDYGLEEITNAQLKLDYLNSGGLVDDLKILTSSVMGEYQGYSKGVADGSLFQNEEFEKKFENGFGGVIISLDDNLRPVTLFKGTGEDLDGDGILDVETMDSLNDVYARPQFQRNFDYDAMVKKHSEKLVSAINQTDNGITKTKTTGVEADLLSNSVNRFLYNDDNTPSAPMLAFLRNKGLDPNNPEDLKNVENNYKNDIYLRTKRGEEVDVDGSTALARTKYNDEKESVSIGETVTPTKETWGKQYQNIDTSKYLNVPVSGVQIDAIPLKDGRTITDADIMNYTYSKDGNMIIDVVYQDTKSETMSVSKYDDEIEEATKNNDNKRLFELKQAKDVDGGKKVTLPGQKKKEQIIISKENESKVANKVAGSIEKAKALATKETKEEQVDEFGIPIEN